MLDKLGFLKPSYKNEKRVALLPEDVKKINREIWIESGFGDSLGINDYDYENEGAKIKSRKQIFENCNNIFCLKVLQPSDYDHIKPYSNIVGWVHPFGSGLEFMEKAAIPKNVFVFDTDGKNPRIFHKHNSIKIKGVSENFLFENSYMAGISSVLHALLSHGYLPSLDDNIAVLSPGNVAQGAFSILSKLGNSPRIFYRKTMNEFLDNISSFDIIVNGIETDGSYIIDENSVKKIKKGALVIDAAADMGNAIYGTRFTTHDDPIYEKDGVYYYCINNSPSILYRSISENLSRVFTKEIYNLPFNDLRRELEDL